MTAGAAARLHKWFVDDALPLWAARGYDAARGGFYESLDFNGEPVTGQPRRVRVQARQIYMFSEAGARRWHPDAEAIAVEGFDYFLARACPDGGERGCIHLLADDGTVLDDRRNLYDQAFLLLACAGRWRAAKDERAFDLANRTISFLDRELASPHGGWLESDRRELPRRQNPHMHLFEAFLALYGATGENAFRKYAEKVFSLFEQYFYDTETGVLHEFFKENWALAAGAPGGQIQPGHMMEWVWLINEYGAASPALRDISARLYARAEALGRNEAGFLVDSVDLDAPAASGPRRLWPQTEYLRAALIRARQGDNGAAAEARLLVERLFKTYLKQNTLGLWCDQFDANGAPIAKDVPASILYHLLGAASEAGAYMAIKERT